MVASVALSEAMNLVGFLGRFQLIFIIIFVISSIINGSVVFQFQALSIMPKVICLSKRCKMLKGNGNDDSVICHLKDDEWMFEDTRQNWLTEFNLYCDNLYLKSMGTTVYFIGFMLGVSVLSSLCDKFGRRRANIFFLLGFLIVLIGLKYSVTLYQVFAYRMALGFFHSGISISLFTAVSEFTLPNVSTFANILSGIGFSFGSAVASFFAYHYKYWQDSLQPIIFMQLTVLLIYFVLCPETPFWLLAQNRKSDAINSLNFVSEVNGNPPLSNKCFQFFDYHEDTIASNPFGIIIANRTLKECIMKLSFAWFTVSVCFYALQFNAGSLGDDEYRTMILMGFIDIPARFLMLYLAYKCGRKKAIRWFFIVCTTSLALCLVPHLEEMHLGNVSYKSMLVMVGHGIGGAVFSLLYTYTSELLPTLARSTGVSICSTTARIASLLSPFVIILNQISGSLIYLISLLCLVVSMSLMKSIPETLDKPLPNNVEDCEELFHGKSKVGTI